jgi:carboxyl-terminal processing protease
LKKNSELRIKNNKNYQNFLQEIRKKKFDSESVELFGQTDLQMQECLDIMKDLLFVMQMNEKPFE